MEVRKSAVKWLAKLESANEEPIDSTVSSKLLTFDNMGRIGFSKDFGLTEIGKQSHMLRLLEATFKPMALLGALFWPLAIARDLGLDTDMREFENLSKTMVDERQAVGALVHPGLSSR